MSSPRRRPQAWRSRDYGRLVARLLCAVFALIGALPLAGGLLVRSDPVLDWASKETARVLEQELGVQASYRVRMQLWPLSLSLEDVVVPAKDGGPPAFEAERIAVRPRFFSLLAGRLDVGDIELDAPTVRLVVRDGAVTNVSYRLPKRDGPAPEMTQAPFSSLGITDARLELDVEGSRVAAGPMDIDVFAERGPSFEVAVRATDTFVSRPRPVTVKAADDAKASSDDSTQKRSITFDAWDEDAICRVDLRARIDPEGVLVRRLSLLGRADQDPAAGTRPSCSDLDEDDDARVALRLSQVRVGWRKGEAPLIDGNVVVRAPASLTNRFVAIAPLSGWAGFSGDVRYDGHGRLPEVRGKVRGQRLQIDVYRLAKKLDVDVEVSGDRISMRHFEMHFADGSVVVKNSTIEPFAPGAPMKAERMDGKGVQFEGLMRDLGVTPDTIIKWDLVSTRVTKIHGKLSPLRIEGDMVGESRDFEVFDRSHRDPARQRMIGVRAAAVRSRFVVKPTSLDFVDVRTSFGKSGVNAKLVSIGFSNDLALEISKSKIDLSDVSPIVQIPWAGVAELSASMSGKANDPVLTGDIAIQKFEMGGFPLGDLKSGKVRFRPLKVDFFDVRGVKNKSDFRIASARLDFDTDSSLRADAKVSAERFDVRDFFAMFLFDKDPRFDQIHGVGKIDVDVHYDLGGRKDRCGGGLLRVAGDMNLAKVDLFEERYDSARANFDFRWLDRDASYLGIEMDVPSVALTKGQGTLLGSFAMKTGGRLSGHAVGTSVPLSKIDSMGQLGLLVDGRGSGSAEISGTVDALEVKSHVRLTPVRIGTSTLPASEMSVVLEPVRRPLRVIGRTRCGGAVTGPFDRAEWESDRSQGTFHVSGRLFGGQVKLSDLTVTRQRKKTVEGVVDFDRLDLGALSELSPTVALSGARPRGRASGTLAIQKLPLDKPSAAEARLALANLELERSGYRVEMIPGSRPVTVAEGKLEVPNLSLSLRTPRGMRAVFDLKGVVDDLPGARTVDASLALRPMDLGVLASAIPRAERVNGRLAGKLGVSGPLKALRYKGGFRLEKGEVFLRGMASPITDIDVALDVDDDELKISRAKARIGSGTISVTGGAPLRGFELGAARAVITARELALPPQAGLKAAVDANLVATWRPATDADTERPLPRVTGDVTLRSFEYTRPITMTADLSSLAARGKRTEFEAYDPSNDFVEFDVTLRANRPLAIRNNLIETELTIDRQGLQLAGTNERYGMRGEVRVKPGGRIRMRRSEFEVRQGHVRFDDLTRVAPQVDLTAVTEYKRYSEAQASEGAASSGASTGGAGTAAQGGRWLITMHAHGDAENLRIDLTSDPGLAQDDIFLLLTVGLTRAELDQAQSASVGESVALEALGTLSGADRAVTRAIPVIDEFRFGSAYSSRTGRTEPTVTIGKRLAERIRANVTSGLAESREIRSNLEWRLSNRVSVEGSYDNVNDISSSTLGNLGADIRWRLEFE